MKLSIQLNTAGATLSLATFWTLFVLLLTLCGMTLQNKDSALGQNPQNHCYLFSFL